MEYMQQHKMALFKDELNFSDELNPMLYRPAALISGVDRNSVLLPSPERLR